MKLLAALVLTCFMSGCSSLHPVVDETRYFVLSADRSQSGTPKSPYVGISHVELPDYLKKRAIAWRFGDQEIRYAPNLEWAVPLETRIAQVLASTIGAVVAPNYRRTEIQAELSVVVLRFEPDQTGHVIAEADWTIRYSSSSTVRGTAKASSQGPLLQGDPAGAVAALSKTLAELGKEILKNVDVPP